MQIRTLLDDDDAVSPVIGVILMVAITVILAAVIGTFVLGLGDQVQTTTPQVSFSFEHDDSADELVISHASGQSIAAAKLDVVTPSGTVGSWSDDPVSAGDTLTISSFTPSDGDTVRVTWESDDGSNSAVLGEWSY